MKRPHGLFLISEKKRRIDFFSFLLIKFPAVVPAPAQVQV